MENFKNNMMEYWLVKLGNLFYAGGILRKLPENENAKSYEFNTEEETAFVLFFEDGAKEIAENVGGVVIKREKSYEEVANLREKFDKYMESKKELEADALKTITEEIHNYNND